MVRTFWERVQYHRQRWSFPRPRNQVKILCGCGREHSSMAEWQACPMALTPIKLEPWWRVRGALMHLPEENPFEMTARYFVGFGALCLIGWGLTEAWRYVFG
jgi:hypothetical protein